MLAHPLQFAGDFKSRRRALQVGIAALKRFVGLLGEPFLDHDAVEFSDEVDIPELAPILAIGHRLQADIFLHLHDIANAAVFDRAQLGIIDLAAFPLIPRLQQLRRSQQTADMIGAKRRFFLLSHGDSPLFCSQHTLNLKHITPYCRKHQQQCRGDQNAHRTYQHCHANASARRRLLHTRRTEQRRGDVLPRQSDEFLRLRRALSGAAYHCD